MEDKKPSLEAVMQMLFGVEGLPLAPHDNGHKQKNVLALYSMSVFTGIEYGETGKSWLACADCFCCSDIQLSEKGLIVAFQSFPLLLDILSFCLSSRPRGPFSFVCLMVAQDTPASSSCQLQSRITDWRAIRARLLHRPALLMSFPHH